MGKKLRCGSGIWVRDKYFGSYFRELRNRIFWIKILKFFDADPGSGNLFDHESEMEKFRSWIRDKHPGSATVVHLSEFLLFCQADNGECDIPPSAGLRLLF
jgi:hypothetical protein